MLVLACTPGISFTEDLGRHLLLGGIIARSGRVPDTNFITYTWPDFPFVNHHWLSQVAFHFWHRWFGFNGLILGKMVLMATTVVVACRVTLGKGSGEGNGWRWFVFYLSGLLAAITLGFRAHVRPELFTYAFVAVVLWGLERLRRGRHPIWTRVGLSSLMILWLNCHIYFVFGMGMLGAFVIENALTRWKLKSIVWDCVWFIGTAILLCLLNPNGLDGVLFPKLIFTNYAVSITENLPPTTLLKRVVNPMLLALPTLSVLTIWVVAADAWSRLRNSLGRRGRRGVWAVACRELRLANVIIVAAALIAAWMMVRSAPLLAICSLPIVAVWATRANSSGVSTERISWRFALGLLAALNTALIVCVVTGNYSRFFPSPIAPTAFGFDVEERYHQIRRLKKLHDLVGPLFSDYDLGSLVEYEVWPVPGYADNRPEAFPGDFWTGEYASALRGGEAWRTISERRGFNVALVSLWGAGEAFFAGMNRDPNWVLIHLDEFSAVWLRDRPENQKTIRSLRFDDAKFRAFAKSVSAELLELPDQPFWLRPVFAERILFRLYALYLVGRGDLVWPCVWHLHRMYPRYQMVHELLRTTAPPEAGRLVDGVLAAQARWPRSWKQVVDWSARLEAQGRGEEADQVRSRGRWFFPLNRDD